MRETKRTSVTKKHRCETIHGGSFILKFTVFLLVPVILFSFQSASAQTVAEEKITIDDDTPINVDTLLFTIPLTVTDKKGRSIVGLKQENFSVFQDGNEQEIEFFQNDEAPMNVAILLDTSRSTKDVLGKIQSAAHEFIKILRPEDKAVIAAFDSRTIFLSGLDSDRKKLSKAIDRARVTNESGSDMYQAIDLLVKRHFADLKGRKAVIVLTDGMVIANKITAQTALDSMQKADTFFYPIIFKTDFYKSGKSTAKNSAIVNVLRIFAEETSGTFYEKEATKLKEAFQSIAGELKKQYLIGFYPKNTERGKTTGYIRVDVNRGDLLVRAKKRLRF